LRPRHAEHGQQRGSARAQTQKSSAGKSHGVTSMNATGQRCAGGDAPIGFLAYFGRMMVTTI